MRPSARRRSRGRASRTFLAPLLLAATALPERQRAPSQGELKQHRTDGLAASEALLECLDGVRGAANRAYGVFCALARGLQRGRLSPTFCA